MSTARGTGDHKDTNGVMKILHLTALPGLRSISIGGLGLSFILQGPKMRARKHMISGHLGVPLYRDCTSPTKGI